MMGTKKRGGLPLDLARAQSRFDAWRSLRARGERIPRRLWTLAVQLAKRHGVSRTATALRLDYYGLQERAEATSRERRSHGPAFVELPSPLAVSKRCLVKLNNGAGASMRVQLVGYETADVEALTRTFWNAG
jgi:hypothetical protein